MAMRSRRVVRGTMCGFVALGAGIACSSGAPAPHAAGNAVSDSGTPGRATHASAFMLSEDQRARIHTDVLAPMAFQPTIATTGTVAFNGDRSTPVVSQISGPVARILVNTGAHVEAGTALALVSSPDFAQAIAASRSAAADVESERA